VSVEQETGLVRLGGAGETGRAGGGVGDEQADGGGCSVDSIGLPACA